MNCFSDDKLLFYIRDDFGTENKIIERYIPRGNRDMLRYYINQTMITEKGKNMKALNVELSEKRSAPFLPY